MSVHHCRLTRPSPVMPSVFLLVPIAIKLGEESITLENPSQTNRAESALFAWSVKYGRADLGLADPRVQIDNILIDVVARDRWLCRIGQIADNFVPLSCMQLFKQLAKSDIDPNTKRLALQRPASLVSFRSANPSHCGIDRSALLTESNVETACPSRQFLYSDPQPFRPSSVDLSRSETIIHFPANSHAPFPLRRNGGDKSENRRDASLHLRQRKKREHSFRKFSVAD